MTVHTCTSLDVSESELPLFNFLRILQSFTLTSDRMIVFPIEKGAKTHFIKVLTAISSEKIAVTLISTASFILNLLYPL